MSVGRKITAKLHDKLATFRWFERTIATVCLMIPLILWLAYKDPKCQYNFCFLYSISDYAYMDHSYVFGMLLTIAAMLFIFNGAVYFNNQNKLPLQLSAYGKWYNVILGLSLLCVIIFPCNQFPVLHDIFAAIFFLGNALVIGIFYRKKYRILSMTLAVLTVASLGLSVWGIVPWFTLLWGEWISLIVIGVHFILESL